MYNSEKVRYLLQIILATTLMFVTWSQLNKLDLEITSNSFRHIETTSLPLPSVTFCIKWYRSPEALLYLPDSKNWTFADYLKLSKRFKDTIVVAELSDQSSESITP